MVSTHVFAIDWLPDRMDVAGGGGLRSLQIVEALRALGHTVTVSLPRGTRSVQSLEVVEPERARTLLLHDERNQAEILREVRPDVVVWLWPSVRNVPIGGANGPIHVCDLNGLQDFEMAGGSARSLERSRGLLRDACRHADLVLTGSGEQHGYWLAELGRDGAPPRTAVVPYALSRGMRSAGADAVCGLRRIHFVGNVFSWSASVAHLARVAAWVGGRRDIRFSLICGIDAALGTRLSEVQLLRSLENIPGVDIRDDVAFGEAMDQYGPGSLGLEFYDPSVERLLAVPIRTINALAHGVPTLGNVASALTDRIVRAGAGVLVAGSGGAAGNEIEHALDRLAALPAEAFAKMSAAARHVAEEAFSPEAARDTLGAAIDEALDRRRRRVRGWRGAEHDETPLGHVLVMSNEEDNLRELRVTIPFGALHRRQLISGYTVWSKGRVVQGSRRDGALPGFDALWVQRCSSAELSLAIDALGLPYVYDLDDNLLISPAYRQPFGAETVQAVRCFIRNAAVLSSSTGRIAVHLQRHVGTRLVDKTVVTPNLARGSPPPRLAGEPNCVVWASSDTPALTASRSEVQRAIRDFCLTHALRLVCIGVAPPDTMLGDDLRIEHVGPLGYSSYLEYLRSLAPAIIVCPMETTGDPFTQEFVECKSDIKLLEALCTGLVGVFSAAWAYRESELPGAIFARNDYRSWFNALRTAREACRRADGPQHEVPPDRTANASGLMPWFDALKRARLPRPVHIGEVTDALSMIRARVGRHLLGPEEFDGEFYLARYPDVRQAVEKGHFASGFEHYLNTGFAEWRAGREGDTITTNAEQLWANLLHTVGDVRQSVENRTVAIEDLKRRRDTQVKLRRARL